MDKCPDKNAKIAYEKKIASMSKAELKSQKLEDIKKKIDSDKESKEGEDTEEDLFDELQNYYNNKNGIICVLQGLECSVFGKIKQKIEKDFIIINPLKRCIIAIECKKTISENSIKTALKQLASTKQIIQDWFGPDLKDVNWKFVPMVFGLNVQGADIISHDHIIIGNFKIKIQNLSLDSKFNQSFGRSLYISAFLRDSFQSRAMRSRLHYGKNIECATRLKLKNLFAPRSRIRISLECPKIKNPRTVISFM